MDVNRPHSVQIHAPIIDSGHSSIGQSVFDGKTTAILTFALGRFGLKIAASRESPSAGINPANAKLDQASVSMNGNSAASRLGGNALAAIAMGGLIAGALDLTQAYILFGPKVPLTIAAGLLGPQAFHGGKATYVLGVILHFFIAFSVTAIYYAASRRLKFLTDYALICGLFFGIAVELVMRLIVLPLSALHARGPYQYVGLVQGLLVHMVLIGLPISFSVRRFANR